MNQITKIAVKAAEQSGKMLLAEYKRFNRAEAMLKPHNELVTKNDLRSEEIIIGAIQKNFPHHGILSEERGRIQGSDDHIWVIDPIDGTTNFTMRNPLWCISIGVVRDEELESGVVYAPFLDELFVAEKGKGSFLNGKRISVSRINSGKILNTYCHSRNPRDVKRAIRYYSRQKQAESDCRQMGSAALELCFIAAGRVESFIAPGANDWDVAAGALIVREAGGRVTDFKNREWFLGSGDIAATNGLVHHSILEKL